MENLTKEEKEKLARKAFESIISLAKLHGYNLLDLDKKMQDLLISVYQQGIEDFWEEFKKINKAKLDI